MALERGLRWLPRDTPEKGPVSDRPYCELLHYRIRRGWTLRRLSETAGLSIATLWRIERGITKASPRTFVRLQDALGVDAPELQRLLALPGVEKPARNLRDAAN